MEPILRCCSVEVSFHGRAVTHNVSFALQKGEILGIVGESGSGKSTLLKAALGLLGTGGLVTRGDIWFQGKDLPDLPERELRRICGAEIGMIFQDAGASLCPVRTIGDQMAESMAAHRKITRAQAKERRCRCLKPFSSRTARASGKVTRLSFPAGCSSAWGSPSPCV